MERHPVSIAEYLVGTWKRNLEWKGFGDTFSHLRATNTIVTIEELATNAEPDSKFLKWSFGKTLQNQLYGYTMRFMHEPEKEQTIIEWQYGGEACSGVFSSTTSCMILPFYLKTTSVVITMRVVDHNNIAVVIVEVDESSSPTIQYGNMMRIDPIIYSSLENSPSK